EHSDNDCPDGGCEGNFCNPFQVCGSCFVLIQNHISAETIPQVIVPKQKFAYQTNLSSRFIFEFWHPPELV
ncbi:MAG: hypothetical protein AAF705_11420, partial [Bacteroidota bacterium]